MSQGYCITAFYIIDCYIYRERYTDYYLDYYIYRDRDRERERKR